ncbi:hypothetical protein P3T36_004423 [Kitasatospora sp. MAP12-15]|uniref:hypothetical protein n=1 Tax=unclassified Kitasatospora TaxID=2633591 RepID=UPI0024749888|nr:hypothetical protein [Kitasatospora sp. MAP12-44]MDH6110849.1 hypothetical protein [Kitasatospora sp. MAP12-44]
MTGRPPSVRVLLLGVVLSLLVSAALASLAVAALDAGRYGLRSPIWLLTFCAAVLASVSVLEPIIRKIQRRALRRSRR